MEDPKSDLLEINLKIRKLLQDNQDLQKQVAELRNSAKLIGQALEDQKNTNKALVEQNKIVKIAVALSDQPESSAELRKVIQQHIREIDECIRLITDSTL